MNNTKEFYYTNFHEIYMSGLTNAGIDVNYNLDIYFEPKGYVSVTFSLNDLFLPSFIDYCNSYVKNISLVIVNDTGDVIVSEFDDLTQTYTINLQIYPKYEGMSSYELKTRWVEYLYNLTHGWQRKYNNFYDEEYELHR